MIQARLTTFLRRALTFEFFSRLEHGEHIADRLRVVPGLHHVLHAEAIRLHLVLAAITHHPGLRADIGELTDGIGAGENGRRHCAQRSGNAASLAASGMARRDVTDFVAENARELRFGIEIHEQAAVHVDVAAPGGECIDAFVIDDEELEFLVRQIADERQALADDVHVFLGGLVVVEAQRLDDFLVVLLGGLLFTFPGTHYDVFPTRRRVAAAPATNTQVAAIRSGNSRMRFIV